ncbi:MAG: tryptophan 2,3-dioxygenase family protein [Gemmatimonadales bacterium]
MTQAGDRSPETDRSRELDYGSYLALDELLGAQRPLSRPEHHDELLFIVVHQASELWFKVVLHELDELVARLGRADAPAALLTLRRINDLVAIVTNQLSALDTLPPRRFNEFRGYLGSSSGSQSEQFRAIEVTSGLRDREFLNIIAEPENLPPLVQRALSRPTLEALFEAMVAARGVTLEQVYTDDALTMLLLLAEELLRYEQAFSRWRFVHVQLVERIIGPDTAGTGGSLGAKDLRKTVDFRFFPKLWAMRSRLYGAAQPST